MTAPPAGPTQLTPLTRPMPLFVSYARDDSALVLPIVERLKGDGFQLWIDLEGLEGAAFWRKEIVDAIEEAPAVLFFASKASCASENISKELSLASEERKPILPIFLEDVKLPSELRYQLAGLQRITWYEKPPLAYAQATAALSRLLQRPPTAQIEKASTGPRIKLSAISRRTFAAGTATALSASGIATGYMFWKQKGQTSLPPADSNVEPLTRAAPDALPSTLAERKALDLRALVIGNQNYATANRLLNPISDAKRVADYLRRHGFTLTELFDATTAETRERASGIYANAPRTRGIARPSAFSGTNPTVYFVFYSGHAVSLDNQPCIVPVDVDLSSESKVRSYTIPFRELLASNFGIKPRNQLTLFSAAPGQMAEDGQGQNSPFTSAFIRHLQNPSLDVATMFSYVTRDVRRATNDRQTPWVEGSLDAPLFLGDLARSNIEGTTLVSVFDACRDAPFAKAVR